MNSRTIIGFLIALLLVAGGVRLWKQLSAFDALQPLAPDAQLVREPEAPRADLSPIERDAGADRTTPREIVDPHALTTNARSDATCRVLGRVLDARGRPVGGVDAVLLTKDVTLHSVTGADGRFGITSPMPPGGWFTLELVPPIWFARQQVEFEAAADGTKRKLAPGDNDLGDVVLRDAGAVEGRVVGDRGEPIEGASVAVASKSSVLGAAVLTGADGRFVLGGMPEGKIGLQVSREHCLKRPSVTCVVALGTTTHVPDVVLTAAPFVSGVVVDEAGAPVRGVSVRARTASTFGAATESADDGTFVAWFGANSPHWIEVPATSEFEAYGRSNLDKTTLIEPGTTGVRVVLRRAAQITFRVVDAATRAPIESFALRVVREPGPKPASRGTPPIVTHLGGVVREAATVGVSLVQVWAADRSPRESQVALDAGSSDTQTIALSKGGAIVGHVAPGTQPVEDVTLYLFREAFRKDGGLADDPLAPGPDTQYDVASIAESTRPQRSLSDGGFDFQNLLAGTYALALQDADGTRTLVRDLRVTDGQVLDLGEVVRVKGASVIGRLVPPSDESPIGYQVALTIEPRAGAPNSISNRIQRIAKDDGAFSFAGLEPGNYSLSWLRPEDAGTVKPFASASSTRFSLNAGETREVVLDASRSSPCRIDVLVTRAGAPAVGVSVVATIRASGSASSEAPRDASTAKFGPGADTRFLGTTNADGRVSGSIDGNVTFDLTAMGEGKVVLARSDAPLVSTPRGHLECKLDVRVGSIALEIPASLPPVPDGSVTISMSRAGGGSATFWLTSPTASFRRDDDRSWTVGVNALGQVPAGDYAVTVTFQRMVIDRDSPKGSRMDPVREPYRTNVTVAEGADARIVVP